jgi:peroxiredoxin
MNRYLPLRLVIGLGFTVLFAGACGALAPAPTPKSIPPTATTAATLTPVSPTATLASRGVVYFFFVTGCAACSQQARIMEQFHQDNPNIMVVGVPVYANQKAAQGFASGYGLTFEVREDIDLVNALGAVTRHPVIAFQSASGGPLTRASDGVISEKTLIESFQSFVSGGSVTVSRGFG